MIFSLLAWRFHYNYSRERIKNNSGCINVRLIQPELGMKLNNLDYNVNIAFTPTTGVFI